MARRAASHVQTTPIGTNLASVSARKTGSERLATYSLSVTPSVGTINAEARGLLCASRAMITHTATRRANVCALQAGLGTAAMHTTGNVMESATHATDQPHLTVSAALLMLSSTLTICAYARSGGPEPAARSSADAAIQSEPAAKGQVSQIVYTALKTHSGLSMELVNALMDGWDLTVGR